MIPTNINRADAKLATLQGRDDKANNFTEEQKSEMSIYFQNHMADPVSGLIGLNSSSGGTVSNKEVGKPKEIVLTIKEAGKAAFGKETTAHNCYGHGTGDCTDESNLLKDGLMLWEPTYKPKQQQDNKEVKIITQEQEEEIQP